MTRQMVMRLVLARLCQRLPHLLQLRENILNIIYKHKPCRHGRCCARLLKGSLVKHNGRDYCIFEDDGVMIAQLHAQEGMKVRSEEFLKVVHKMLGFGSRIVRTPRYSGTAES